MGSANARQEAGPQVHERHVRALYVNIPVEAEVLQKLLLPPMEPDLHRGKAWLSVVIDDLYLLKAPTCGAFVPVPGMNGWMMKLNALVRCPLGPQQKPVPGYQILTIDFESGFGGWFKKLGAKATQRVPSALSRFEVSSGRSGRTAESWMNSEEPYFATVNLRATDESLVDVGGRLARMQQQDQELCEFVVERPHKFLVQGTPPNRLAYASWRDFDCSAKGCMQVVASQLKLPVLDRLAAALDGAELFPKDRLLKDAVCFLQPEYTMTDCKNTLMPVERASRASDPDVTFA